MFDRIKEIFGFGPQTDYRQLMKRGAVIVDVRNRREFQSGHIDGAVNIPLDQLESHLSSFSRANPVITCCASGMRSATAKSILVSRGFQEVYNGGGWSNLNDKLR